MRTILFAIAATALATGAAAETFECSQAIDSPYPALVSGPHQHRRYAPEARGLSKDFTAYASVFDHEDDDDGDDRPDLRFSPEYVAYEIRGVGPDSNGQYAEPKLSISRPRWYRSAEFLPLLQRAGVAATRIDDSYAGVGSTWNRGHLAMADHAQRISGPASCNTHTFWNAVPQAAEMNQGPWMHLENYSAAASNKFGRVWVIAGPIYDPTTPKLTIGDAGEAPVEVPDALFKVIVRETPTGPDALAFIFDQANAAGPDGSPRPIGSWVKCNVAQRRGYRYDHSPLLAPIAQIELRTGLRFFVDRPDREALTSRAASALWPIEQQYWDPTTVCARQRNHP